jgi:hypothetical protein
MNEPLTNPCPEISFSGKAFNKHPQWYNQPLRLTKEQMQDPMLILDDFFQCYHLNETRQILWEWFTEVISSSRSISIEGLGRSNHVYFYEKVEEIIEAAFVIKKRLHKRRLRKQKKKNKRNSQFIAKTKTNNNTNRQISDFEFVEKDVILNKPKQLIEFVNDAPVFVITEVFKEESLSCLSNQLRNWLQVALSDDSSIYEVGEQRQQLIAFHDELQLFVEALFVICSRNTNDKTIKEKTAVTKISLLNPEQIANPSQVITAFYDKFPMAYVLRELNDWLEAGISYPGTYPDTMSELQALHTFRTVVCLIKSADRLIRRQIVP